MPVCSLRTLESGIRAHGWGPQFAGSGKGGKSSEELLKYLPQQYGLWGVESKFLLFFQAAYHPQLDLCVTSTPYIHRL